MADGKQTHHICRESLRGRGFRQHAVRRDCRIEEILGDFPVLKQMDQTEVNLDELDYLTKRLDSFDEYERTQFQGMASWLNLHGVDEMINLTFCCQEATVATDFSDLQ